MHFSRPLPFWPKAKKAKEGLAIDRFFFSIRFSNLVYESDFVRLVRPAVRPAVRPSLLHQNFLFRLVKLQTICVSRAVIK